MTAAKRKNEWFRGSNHLQCLGGKFRPHQNNKEKGHSKTMKIEEERTQSQGGRKKHGKKITLEEKGGKKRRDDHLSPTKAPQGGFGLKKKGFWDVLRAGRETFQRQSKKQWGKRNKSG